MNKLVVVGGSGFLLLIATLLGLNGCGAEVPPENFDRIASPVEESPRVAGYFSLCTGAPRALEVRVVEEARGSNRALLLVQSISRVPVRANPVRFRNSDGTIAEYDVRTVRMRVVRELNNRLARVDLHEGDYLDLLVVVESSVRRFDHEGRMFVPFPGSQSGISEPDARSVEIPGEFVAVVSDSEEGRFLLETAPVAGGEVLGDHERVQLDELVRRVQDGHARE